MDVEAALSLMLALIDNLQRVSQVIAQAKAAGRTQLTGDEWSGILAADDAARAALGAPPSSPPADVAPQPGAT